MFEKLQAMLLALMLAVGGLSFSVLAVGCEDDAGDDIEDAADDVGDNLEDAADEVEDAFD